MAPLMTGYRGGSLVEQSLEKTSVLHRGPTSVTQAELTVTEELTKAGERLRTLSLDGQCQSEITVRKDESFAPVQPLELVQVLLLGSLTWASGDLAEDEASLCARVLLLGLGGGSVARGLATLLPPEGRVHSVELEPEVLAAATRFFGLHIDSERCTAEAADAGEHLRLAAEARSGAREEDGVDGEGEVAGSAAGGAAGGAAGSAMGGAAGGAAGSAAGDAIVILDAFDVKGLASAVQQERALDDAATIAGRTGLVLANLHAGYPSDPNDPDHEQLASMLRRLCARFDAVCRMDCDSTLNVIVFAHQGEQIEPTEWGAAMSAQLGRRDVDEWCMGLDLAEAMSRFTYVGGRKDTRKRKATKKKAR